MANQRILIIELTANQEREIARCDRLEDAEAIVSALRRDRNGCVTGRAEGAPDPDTEWELR